MGVLCSDSLPAVHIASNGLKWTILRTTYLGKEIITKKNLKKKKTKNKINECIFVLKYITVQKKKKQNKRKLMKTIGSSKSSYFL